MWATSFHVCASDSDGEYNDAFENGQKFQLTGEPPSPTCCYDWKYEFPLTYSHFFSQINSLNRPLDTVKEGEDQAYSTLRNTSSVSPLKRLILILALQATQEEREATIADLGKLYTEGSQERMVLDQFKTFHKKFGENNPFGVLFNAVKGKAIMPRSHNKFKRFVLPEMIEIENKYLSNQQSI